MWASSNAKQWLQPLIVSHGWGAGFTSSFIWDGNRDYSAVLAIPATLRWWQAVGHSRALEYIRETLAVGLGTLLTRWQTHLLAPLSLCATNMALVRLPSEQPTTFTELGTLLVREPPPDDGSATSTDAKRWQDWLFDRGMEVPCKCIQGHLYVRISVAIYNCEEDFHRLAAAVLEHVD